MSKPPLDLEDHLLLLGKQLIHLLIGAEFLKDLPSLNQRMLIFLLLGEPEALEPRLHRLGQDQKVLL